MSSLWLAGLVDNQALVFLSIQYIINVVMTIPALLFLDRRGRRRPLLLTGSILVALWMFLVGGILGQYGAPTDEVGGNYSIRYTISGPPSKAGIAFTYLFVASFAPTWGPGIWVYVSEIYPLSARGMANGLAGACYWAFNFALAFFVPSAFERITYRTYFIFGAFNLAAFVQEYFQYPETCGKSLEEIETIFTAHEKPWSTKKKPLRPDEEAKAIATATLGDQEKGQSTYGQMDSKDS